MVGFSYRGQSTEDIISVPLILVNQGDIGTIGMTRSKVEGARTISRFRTNEYGTIYEPLQFTYCLMKQDGEPFTDQEQIIIERWLTSPKLSSDVIVTNCDDAEYSYFGLFTGTNWIMGNGGLFLCEFTFLCNDAYAHEHSDQTIWGPYNDMFDETYTDIERVNGMVEVNILTDEPEEYVYPVIRATYQPPILEEGEEYAYDETDSTSFSITHVEDGRSMTITTLRNDTVVIDCEHNMVYAGAMGAVSGEFLYRRALRYDEIGWSNVENIQWIRLLPGVNTFHIFGKVNVELAYTIPRKKVGGWLV